MGDYLQILVLITISAALFWFGYRLFAGKLPAFAQHRKSQPIKQKPRNPLAAPGDPQVCPICSSKLEKGDLVSTLAFPSITGGRDRPMHIRGCMHCIDGYMERSCPVCGALLGCNDILVARLFERPRRRSHVHVLGCSICKRTLN
ncbi:MAG: hypothetical protein FWH41_08060 [Treponema sp.]|nr:hypothetical protein [Treponema sp.]